MLHVFINLILGAYFYSTEKKELGKTFVLSAFTVLLVGFSSCWGVSTAAGGLRF
ncbi:MAG TPA: hypothetical protein VD905_06420 [Flavobacteriales bacterium]|nr:hypothetical protein [Flavobacteriales bacterium]